MSGAAATVQERSDHAAVAGEEQRRAGDQRPVGESRRADRNATVERLVDFGRVQRTHAVVTGVAQIAVGRSSFAG